MRFVFVIVTLFTINFIHLLVLRKWGMSEKVDKGIMMWYGKLSYRIERIEVSYGFICIQSWFLKDTVSQQMTT